MRSKVSSLAVLASLAVACGATPSREASGGGDGGAGSGGASVAEGSTSASSSPNGSGSGTTSTGSGSCDATTPTAFDATPSGYTLPPPRCQTSFDDTSGYVGIVFASMDVDGDRRSDLVVAKDDCDATVGATHWDVYVGGATGFATTPTPFTVPPARCNQEFDDFSGYAGGIVFELVDMDGDGFSDLVVTEDDCDKTVGASHWDVYRGSPTGFATTPAPYLLPAARCNWPFTDTASDETVLWTLADLDGDRLPDLVITHDDCDATVGATHWDVYSGGAAGFAATPAPFAVPPARCMVDFDAFGDDEALAYSAIDIDGDGKAELVVTRDDCDPTVGATHWDVYARTSNGFAATPSPFGVPPARCQVPFAYTSGDNGVDYAVTSFGCGAPSLVVARDDCDATVGATHWDVYPNLGSGFATTPAPIALPAARCDQSFDALGGSSAVRFALAALDGSSTSLLVTKDECDATVGTSHWDLYGLH